MSAITTSALTKRYKQQLAVDGLTLDVPAGSVFGLLGPNGAGKSTTLGMLTALLKPTSGDAWVAGHSITTEAAAVRRAVGIVFQEEMIDFDLTAMQNLEIHARLHHIPARERTAAVDHALSVAKLSDRAKNRVKTFSGGMRRRLEIARGLMHAPKVLFLDEPTLGLDIEARKEIWLEVQELRERSDITVILTTHYLEEADELSDVVAIIDRGRIKAQGAPGELKAKLGGDIVSAKLTGDLEQTKRALQNVSGVKNMKTSGSKIVFRISDGESRVPEIISALQKDGRSLQSFHLQPPSLDDVFLEATGHHLKEDAIST